MDIAAVKKRLEKKQSFLEAIEELSVYVNSITNDTDSFSKVFGLISRVASLLKSRYTNIQYWKKGLELFVLSKEKTALASEKIKLGQYCKDASDFIEHHAGEEGAVPRPDLTFSSQGLTPEDLISLIGASSTSVLPEDHTSDSPSPSDSRRQVLINVLQGLQSVFDTLDAVEESTHRIEAEMEQLLPLTGVLGGAGRARPPASARVVSALPRHVVTDRDLEEIHKESVCAVCTEQLLAQDEIQILPCKHLFHVTCVAPWLARNNSCPVCRLELLTDDHKYEAQKEAAAEAEQERRGAANAVDRLEFQFI